MQTRRNDTIILVPTLPVFVVFSHSRYKDGGNSGLGVGLISIMASYVNTSKYIYIYICIYIYIHLYISIIHTERVQNFLNFWVIRYYVVGLSFKYILIIRYLIYLLRWQQYSTHLHRNNTQNNIKQTILRITQQFGRLCAVPHCCGFYPGICLTTEGKSTEKPQSG